MNKYLMPAALSAALMAPLAAHAVTVVNFGDEIVESKVQAVGGAVVFDFEVLARQPINDIPTVPNIKRFLDML